MNVTGNIQRNQNPTGWTQRIALPTYEVGRAAELLGIGAKRLGHWYLPSRGARGEIAPVLTSRPRRRRLSYLDLIEAVVVKTLRDSGMSIYGIKKAYSYLRDERGIDHPFARMTLEGQGDHIYYDIHMGGITEGTAEATQYGQTILRDVIANYLRPLFTPEQAQKAQEAMQQQLTFDSQMGMTIRWYPMGKDFPVFVDPRFGFGAPVLEASHIPTSILLERHLAKASAQEIAEDFGISEDEVHWALMFEGAEQRPEAA